MRTKSIPMMTYRPFGTMRLVLAFLVMVQHYMQWCFPGSTQQLLMIVEPGNIAVLVFFFLSGFVITEAAEFIYKARPGPFFLNRLLRVAPLYAAAILVSFATLYLVSPFAALTDETGKPMADPITMRNLAANLLMIVPLPGRLALEPDFKLLRIAWALRVEMAFYLCVTLLLLGGNIWKSVPFRQLFNATAAAFLLLSAWNLMMRPQWNPLIGFAPYFCAGGALFFALRGSKPSIFLFVAAAIVSVFATLYQMDGDAHGPDNHIAATILFVVLTASCILLALGRLKNPAMDRLFGDLSYPVYVGHWLPLLLLATLARSYPSASGFAAQLVTTTLGVALPVCYFLLIEPSIGKLRADVRGVAIR